MSLTNRLARNPTINRAAKAALARLPLVLRRALTDVITKGWRNPPIYSGVYSSFAEFRGPLVYPPDDTRMEFARAGLASVHRDQWTGAARLGHQHHLLSLVAGMLDTDSPRILDFGGSGGLDYLSLIRATPLRPQYHIVETPALCTIGQQLWKNDSRISFSNELPDEEQRFDLVYSFSAIHYVAEPIALMERFTRYRPKAILIVYTPFAAKGFVRGVRTAHLNYPLWVISLPETEAAMARVGYRLMSSTTEDVEINVRKLPPPSRLKTMTTLLFVRRFTNG